MIDPPRVELWAILPVLILFGGALIALLGAAFARRAAQAPFVLFTLAVLAAAAASALWLWDREPVTVLGGMASVDRLAVVATLVLCGIGALGAYLGFHYFEEDEFRRNEFYALLLFALGGMALLVAAADLIIVFLAIEVLSLSLYVLTALTFRRGPTEAAMKYFLMGAFASAFLLYGVAMSYGAAATTSIQGLARALTGTTGSQPLAVIAALLLVVGLGFKVSLVPFHMWTPDVYQGAPSPVTAFMSAATKAAVFVALVRVLDVAFVAQQWDLAPAIAALSAVSMVVGSVLAIAQRDVKRMLAYSSVAQAGFILSAFVQPGRDGIAAALFYVITYGAAVLGAFGVVMLISGGIREQTGFDRFRGLIRTQPVLAVLLTIFLLSLAGIPPTAGFVAKVLVFGAATSAGYWPLVLIGALASVAGAFFYLRIVALMAMRDPQGEDAADRAPLPRLVLAVPAAMIVVLGIVPGVIVPLLQEAGVLTW
ncbi:MAG TPA: NADH-quinone oxidoreductase subunit N [Actinomycetota bacterium]|nr:NADH-quinone oxidoreductase subunit N [Actinomycetota bacterium]